MTKFRPEQSTFGVGEISPSMRGRTDVPEYQASCLTLEEAIATRFGGQFKRWGTRFEIEVEENETSTTAPARVISWVIPERGSYILLLRTDGKLHLYDVGSGQFITASVGGNNFGVHPWLGDDVFRLHYTISGKTIKFSGTATVEPKDAVFDDFDITPTFVPVVFRNALKDGVGEDIQSTGPRYRQKIRTVTLELFDIGSGTFIPSLVANTDYFDEEVEGENAAGNTIYRVDGTFVLVLGRASKKSVAVEIITGPRSSSGPTLDWTGPWVRKTTIAGDPWTVSPIDNFAAVGVGQTVLLTAGSTPNVGVNLTGNILAPFSSVAGDDERNNLYLVTKQLTPETFEATVLKGGAGGTENCRRWEVEPQPDKEQRIAITPSAVNEGFSVVLTSSDPFFTAKMFDPPRARMWINGGFVRLDVRNSQVSADGTILERLDSTRPTTDWAISWSPDTGFPRSVTSHQQRVFYGLSDEFKSTRTGKSMDWTTGPEDDDGLSFKLISDKPQNIQWLMSSADALLVGTEYAEIAVQGLPLTPSSINASRQTTFGSGPVQPQQIQNGAVYTNQLRRAVRYMQLRENIARFEGPDLSDTADHLFADDQILEYSYGRGDADILYVVMDSGNLNSLTYRPENGVQSWNRWKSLNVKSADRLTLTDRDVVFICVEREVDGQTTYYLESVDCACQYMDSHITVTSPGSSVITGLDHLEGLEVQVVTDGRDFGDATVSGGQIDLEDIQMLDELPESVSVGIGYSMILQPQSIPVNTPSGSTSGERRTVVRLLALIRGASGVEVKSAEGDFVPIPGTSTDGEAPEEETRWYDISGIALDDESEMPTLRQSRPHRTEILAVKPSIEVVDS